MEEDMEKLMNLNDFKEKPKKTDKQMEEIRERVVKRALEMYNKKYSYKWGGTGPKSYDCSGFTQKVLIDEGFKEFPKHSSHQAEYTGKLNKDKSQLKKGDLVFFFNKNKKRISHVGMYIGIDEKTGKQQFVHSSGKGEVCKGEKVGDKDCEGMKISNLDDGDYAKRWAGFESLEKIAIKEKLLQKEEPKKEINRKIMKNDFEPSENTLGAIKDKEEKKKPVITNMRKNIAEIKAEMSSKMKEAQQNKEENKKENNVKVKVR
jgi:protein p60